MIEYIKGELTELTPAQAVVEAHGVGYLLNISLNTYTAIQDKHDVKLYVHEAIVTGGRDDSYTLYGFYTKQEREIYRMLITVSGVGSNTARMILSAISPTDLVNVIASGNEKALPRCWPLPLLRLYMLAGTRHTGWCSPQNTASSFRLRGSSGGE